MKSITALQFVFIFAFFMIAAIGTVSAQSPSPSFSYKDMTPAQVKKDSVWSKGAIKAYKEQGGPRGTKVAELKIKKELAKKPEGVKTQNAKGEDYYITKLTFKDKTIKWVTSAGPIKKISATKNGSTVTTTIPAHDGGDSEENYGLAREVLIAASDIDSALAKYLELASHDGEPSTPQEMKPWFQAAAAAFEANGVEIFTGTNDFSKAREIANQKPEE